MFLAFGIMAAVFEAQKIPARPGGRLLYDGKGPAYLATGNFGLTASRSLVR